MENSIVESINFPVEDSHNNNPNNNIGESGDNDYDADDENFWLQGAAAPSPLLQALHKTEESLRCLICRNIWHIPVAVEPCHHYFCSQCIRSCWNAMEKKRFATAASKIHCPACRTPVDGRMDYRKCLAANRSLERAVTHYKQTVRPMLQPHRATALQHEEEGHEAVVAAQKILAQVRRAQAQRPEFLLAASSSSSSWSGSRRNQTPTADESSSPKLERKRRLLYNNYNRKQMAEFCRKEGLSDSGSEEALKERHRAYCNKINAECDAAVPRSVAEILQEFNAQEMAKAKLARGIGGSGRTTTKLLQTLYDTRRAAGEASGTNSSDATTTATSAKITTGNAKLDAKMNNNFADMIAKLKMQKQKAKQQQKQGASQDSTETVGSEQKNGADHSKSASLQSTTTQSPSTTHGSEPNQDDNAALENNGTEPLATRTGSATSNHGSPTTSCRILRDTAPYPKATTVSQKGQGDDGSVSVEASLEGSDDSSQQQQQQQQQQQNDISRDSKPLAESAHRTSEEDKRNSVCTIDLTCDESSQDQSLKWMLPTSQTEPTKRRRRPSPKQSKLQVVSKRTTTSAKDNTKRRKTRHNNSMTGPWDCPACTFRNMKNTWSRATCEMCGTSRGAKITPELEQRSSLSS